MLKSEMSNITKLFWVIMGGIAATIGTTIATHAQTVQTIHDTHR